MRAAWGITTTDNGARRPDVKYRAFVSFSHESDERLALALGILASVGADDSIAFWNVDFDEWTRRACRIANRNLTPKEWNTYLPASPYRKSCPDFPGRQD